MNKVNSPLTWDVLTLKRRGFTRDVPRAKPEALWVANSSTLIQGERDAVLVDTFLTKEQSRAQGDWIAALDQLEALQADVVVAGHKVPENPDDPRDIERTRQYLQDFNRVAAATSTAIELYDAMLDLYPDRANPGSLWSGAQAAKKRANRS